MFNETKINFKNPRILKTYKYNKVYIRSFLMSNIVLNPKWNSAINQVENGELILGGARWQCKFSNKTIGRKCLVLKDKVDNDLVKNR